MKMEFTAEKTDGVLFMHTEYKGLLLCWSQGEGETGKGGNDQIEVTYPGDTWTDEDGVVWNAAAE